MEDNFCEKCSVEREEGHRCYVSVNEKFFEEVILDAFFLRCGLCSTCAGLRAVRDSHDWKRLTDIQKQDFSRGYICPSCAKGLGL